MTAPLPEPLPSPTPLPRTAGRAVAATGAGGSRVPDRAGKDPWKEGAGLRPLLERAVAELPALPPGDPRERYGVRNLTVLWLEADKSEHTRRAYYGDLADWLGWCDRTGLDPLAARRADVDAWKGTLAVRGRDGSARPPSAATLARRLAALSSWYRYLLSNDVGDRNPVDAVRRPRTGDAPPLPALDEASAVRLLQHAERRAWRNDSEASWRDAALVSLLLHTGLRVSAITSAQVGDVGRDGEHVVLRYVKKGNTRDLVPLVPAAHAVLRHYLDARARRLAVPVTALQGHLLMTAPRPGGTAEGGDAGTGAGSAGAGSAGVGNAGVGGPTAAGGGAALTQRDVWRTLRTLAAQAGIPQAATITPHTARRTAGTLLLAHGVPVQMVADLLGHRDIRTTRDRYDAHRHKLDSSPAYALADLLAGRDPGSDPGPGPGRGARPAGS